MFNKRHTALILVLVLLVFSFSAYAQVEDWRGDGGGKGGSTNGGGNGNGGDQDNKGGTNNGGKNSDNGNGAGDGTGPVYFDASTIKTFSGSLTAERTDWQVQGSGNCTGTGTHFVFTAGGSTYELILAPYNFLADNGLSLGVGDSITVTGSVVDSYLSTYTNQFIIATSINTGSTTLDLRDDAGYPLWRGSLYGGANGQGIGRGPNGEFYFDADSVTTLSGKLVESLNYWVSAGAGNSTGSGMHYVFEADNGDEYYLMAGPFWFLDDNDFSLEDGMTITVKGSVVDPYNPDIDDHSYLIAVSITNDEATLELRDSEGYPLWVSGANGDYNCPVYDRDDEDVVAGTVSSVRYRSNGDNVDTGMEIIVTKNGTEYRAYLAPQYYCEGLGIDLDKGDGVRVYGTIIDDEIVTRKVINSSGKTFRFRLTDGTPLWQE